MHKNELFATGMYKDTLSQPGCWDALLGRNLEEWQRRMRAPRRGLLMGMGASYYATQAAYLSISHSDTTWQPITSDAVLHYLPESYAYDTVLCVSQSGESADTLAAAEKLQAAGLSLLSVTNDYTSSLAHMSSASLDLGCGEEKGSATKTYTTSVLALFAGVRDWRAIWSGLPQKGRAILESLQPGGEAVLLNKEHSHYFLGTGPNIATAMAAALLCKEKLFLHAEGSGTADFAHGPLEVLDARSTVWIFSTKGRIDDLLLPMAQRIAQTGAMLVIIGEQTARFSQQGFSPAWTFDISLDGPEELGALLFLLPLQMMVLWETARQDYPVDTFRRMDKVLTGYSYSGTEEKA